MFDITGWLIGPEFLGALASFITALLTGVAGAFLSGMFGTTT